MSADRKLRRRFEKSVFSLLRSSQLSDFERHEGEFEACGVGKNETTIFQRNFDDPRVNVNV